MGSQIPIPKKRVEFSRANFRTVSDLWNGFPIEPNQSMTVDSHVDEANDECEEWGQREQGGEHLEPGSVSGNERGPVP